MIIMEFDFYVTKTPLLTVPVALRTVYVLHADTTYDVKKELRGCKDMVALRTTGGSGNIKICGIPEIIVPPYTLLFFKHADVRHYYCSSNVWDFWWFEFCCGEPFDFPLNTLMQVESVENEAYDCMKCLELLRKNDIGSGYLASATLGILLYKWMLYYENNFNTNPYQKAVHKVISYIKTNIDKNLTVKALAEITGFCERRFRQVFINITGVQPKKYIESLRMDMAEELLKNTSFSVGEISYKLGYSSQFHFCNAFRKAHGISPTEYRKKALFMMTQ